MLRYVIHAPLYGLPKCMSIILVSLGFSRRQLPEGFFFFVGNLFLFLFFFQGVVCLWFRLVDTWQVCRTLIGCGNPLQFASGSAAAF